MLSELPEDKKTSLGVSSTNDGSATFVGLSTAKTKETNGFLGFEDQSTKLRELWYRWKALENWVDLAVRPRNCHPDDRWLLRGDGDSDNHDSSCIDDLACLKKQCSLVQTLFNDHLSTLSVETTLWESSLVVQPSQIPGAGMGLYFQPPPEHQNLSKDSTSNTRSGGSILPSGSLVCYYTGHVHTHSSALGLADKSYLMWIRGNTLVDPRPLPHIKARYANDPLNEALVNCAFVPTKLQSPQNETAEASIPHEDTIRTSIVATRDILPGEELFVQYGDVYWNQQPVAGNRLVLGNDKKDINSSDDEEEEDSDDLDETFPFSPLFQSKLGKPMIWEDASEHNTST